MGYWCVYCGRELNVEVVVDELGDEVEIVIHDDVVHPVEYAYDEEERPQ